MKSITVIGMPCNYGGGGTELSHQIECWVRMGINVNIFPTGTLIEPDIKKKFEGKGIKILPTGNTSVLEGMDVISFYSKPFLDKVADYKKVARSVTFVNCMTFSFVKEREVS